MTTLGDNRVNPGQIAIEQILGGINLTAPLGPVAVTTAGDSNVKAMASALSCTLFSLCGAPGDAND